MTVITTHIAAWGALTAAVLYALRLLYSHLSHIWAMQQNGCLRPPSYRHLDPILGFDFFLRFMQSIQQGDSFTFAQQQFNQYGKSYTTNSWGKTMLHTMDARNMQAVLSTHFDKFAVEPVRQDVLEPFMGRGIFTTDGAFWEHSRALIRPLFVKATIGDFSAFDVHVRRLIDLIPGDGSTVDLQPLFKRLFLDTSTEFIFGQSANTLLENSEKSWNTDNFLEAFDNALRGVGNRIFFGKFRFLLGRESAFKRDCKEVHDVVDKFVNDAIDRIETTSQNPKPEKYVLINEMAKLTKDRLNLRFELLNIFLPARDSTAIGVSDIFFHLARYPRVWDKLHCEVSQIDQPLTFESIKSIKYLRYVLNESFRLLSPSGRNTRMCIQDCVLPYGGGPGGKAPILVEKGTEVNMVFRASQRDKEFWGEDADDFRPERWDDPKLRPMWEYIPFSGGGRVCPAQQMVLIESGYIIIKFMEAFRHMENRDPEPLFVEEHKTSMQSRNGVKVAFSSA